MDVFSLNRILYVFSVLVLCVFLTLLTAQGEKGIVVKDATENDLNLEVILAGIKHYDTLVQSGRGRSTLTWEQKTSNAYKVEWKYDLIFDQNQIRMEFEESFSSKRVRYPKRTLVATPSEVWTIGYHKTLGPSYSFQLETQLSPFDEWSDPRHWLTKGAANVDLPTYLKAENFYIKKQETLNDILCYVLEAKQDQQEGKIERFWIAPEQGFRFLKYERHEPRKRDSLGGDFKKGALSTDRTLISYEKYGEVWFPKRGVQRNLHIDSDGKEHFYSGMILVVKDFKVNLAIPPETFSVEIPDDAMIKVQGLHKKLSKKEFLKRYKRK